MPKLPWCLEVEYDPERTDSRSSGFFAALRVVADVKGFHLVTTDGQKVSLDRRDVSRVMLVNAQESAHES